MSNKFAQITKAEKVRLVEALRSEKFRQGRGRLKSIPMLHSSGTSPRYCCIGVQLTLRGIEIPIEESLHGTEEMNLYEKSGITSEDRTEMIRMNDGQLQTFAEIADWVETNLKTSD